MRKLIAYFSASGKTRRAAIALSLITEADLFEIAPAVPYTAKDLDWNDKRSRSSMEMKDESSRPALREAKVDLSGYDMIYIGFPIWWGVAPRAVNTFIESNDLKGLRIVIFATSGGRMSFGASLRNGLKIFAPLLFNILLPLPSEGATRLSNTRRLFDQISSLLRFCHVGEWPKSAIVGHFPK